MSSVHGLLAYSLVPIDAEGKQKEPAFLLWRDKKSTRNQSTTYWGEIVCEKVKQDSGAVDTVARTFSQKTRGLFFSSLTDKGADFDVKMDFDDEEEADHVTHSIKAVKEKIRKAQGVLILFYGERRLYVLPTRYIPDSYLNRMCYHKGECVWVPARLVLAAIRSKVSAVTLAVTYRGLDWPLYLPFTSQLRSHGAVERFLDLLAPFGLSKAEVEASAASMRDAEAEAAAEEAKKAAPPPNPVTVRITVKEALASDLQHESPIIVAIFLNSAFFKDNALEEKERERTFYTCRKCRRRLFGADSVVSHGVDDTGAACTSYFLDDSSDVLALFGGAELFGEASGKVSCPKCQTRVGKYDWAGVQCSCGEYVVPALQIQKGKVDVKVRDVPLDRLQGVAATHNTYVRTPIAAAP